MLNVHGQVTETKLFYVAIYINDKNIKIVSLKERL